MKELKEILIAIKNTYDKLPISEEKHEILADLWTKYYQLCEEKGLYLEESDELCLDGENKSFIFVTNTELKSPRFEYLENALRKLNSNTLFDPENDNYNVSFSEQEAESLLDWTISHARKSLRNLGIDVLGTSLRGLCELGQALTLYPFQQKDFIISINQARLSFDYNKNHYFGTVTIPVINNNQVIEKVYLLDLTYLQFFSTVRCNEGMYDAYEENGFSKSSPDPGYFLTSEEEKAFAKELVEKGYIELTDETAKMYAKGFRKSSLSKEEKDKELPEYDDFSMIVDLSNTHISLPEYELLENGIDINFPSLEIIKMYSLKK